MLQFITNEKALATPAQQILDAIEGGCRWVQIRLKHASDEDIRKLFHDIKDKAKETLTTVIINDRVDLALSLAEEGVAGVHLGKEDMPVSKARMILGAAAVIGVTANTYSDIAAVSNLDIDYFGIGPYAMTSTKEKLAPVLGLEGNRKICFEMEENHILIPHVAVGGITVEDVLPLLEAGVNGIAVSGAIAHADDIVKATRRFMDLLPKTEE